MLYFTWCHQTQSSWSKAGVLVTVWRMTCASRPCITRTSGCGRSDPHSLRVVHHRRLRHTCRPDRTGTAGRGSPAPGCAARGSRASLGWSGLAVPEPGSADLIGPASMFADLHRAGRFYSSPRLFAWLFLGKAESPAMHGIKHSAALLLFTHQDRVQALCCPGPGRAGCQLARALLGRVAGSSGPICSSDSRTQVGSTCLAFLASAGKRGAAAAAW